MNTLVDITTITDHSMPEIYLMGGVWHGSASMRKYFLITNHEHNTSP